MSGFSDTLGGLGDWAESIPGALKQAGKDVAEYPGQASEAVSQIVRGLQEGYGQKVADPIAKYFGMAQPYAEDSQPAPEMPKGDDEFGGHKYKFTKETLDPSQVEDVTSSAFQGQQDPAFEATLNKDNKGFKNIDEGKLTDKEYDALTREAANGNKLAQGILVKGKYKEQRFPSLGQDMAKLEDPFVKALSGLPGLGTTLEGQVQAQTKLYDFSNAEGQVNNLLSGMGSSMRATASPETQAYAGKIAGITGGDPLTTSTAGLPSIESALSELGPAGKLSEKATPNAALLSALLSHAQYETIYGGQAPNTAGQPDWLQQLIAQVTGTAVGGGLVSPALAAGGVGSVPSASPTPTGSNG